MSSDALAQQIQASASIHAGRLARALGLPPWDRDDASQDIALDLWRRIGRHDPGRAGLSTFIGLVAHHQRRKLEGRYRREACRRRYEVSLERPVRTADESLTLADTLADGALPPNTALDLSRVTARLPEPLRALCHALDGNGPETARRACGLSNGEFYRRLATLRLLFRSYGLAPLGGIARPAGK